jgi:diaminopimelate epimerase
MKTYAGKPQELSGIVKQGRPFVKMHGLRNDFVIVDARQELYQPDVPEIVGICDRRVGVGADELLIIEPPRHDTENHYAFVRILNPDGRDVEACGNATRCVAWLFMQESGMSQVSIETMGGTLTCRDKDQKQVNVNMGTLRTHWRDIPLAHELDTLHLKISAGPLNDPVGMNIGNPHAVFFVDDIAAIDLREWGPELQRHPLFPEEANIGAAQVLDNMTLALSVWERPGSLTTACGTGACAAVGAAYRRGLITQKRIKVNMPAGSVDIELMDDGTVEMTGPVEVCYTGFLPAHWQTVSP